MGLAARRGRRPGCWACVSPMPARPLWCGRRRTGAVALPDQVARLARAGAGRPSGPLGELRAAAAGDAGGRGRHPRPRARPARVGTPRPCPLLEAAAARRPDDSGVLVDLLRTDGGDRRVRRSRWCATRPTAPDLADRLGVDPAPALQRLHGELLAADDPVRSGTAMYDGDRGLLGSRPGPRPVARGARQRPAGHRSSGRAASARPAPPRLLAARVARCRACTSSSWSASAPGTTWWPRSAPPSACVAR